MASRKNRKCDNFECPEFGKLVEESVSTCPHCGKCTIKVPGSKVKPIIGIILLILILAVGSIFIFKSCQKEPDDGGGSNNSRNSPTNTVKENPSNKIKTKNPEASEKELFTISASEDICNNLLIPLSKAFLKENGYIDVSLDRANDEIIISSLSADKKEQSYIKLLVSDDTTALSSTKSGKSNFALSGRKAKQKDLGGNLSADPSNEKIIALDGIIILVNNANPLSEIDIDDLEKILCGELRNWKYLNGSDAKINLYINDNDEDTLVFLKDTLSIKSNIDGTSVKEYSELLSKVSSDKTSIGIIPYSLNENGKALAIKHSDSSSLKPDAFTISTEDYPISRRIYLYVSKENSESIMNDFSLFIKNNSKLIASSGYVSDNFMQLPISSIDFSEEWINKDQKKRYMELMQKCSSRLSTNFRFEVNKAKLDDKAQGDVEKIADTLKEKQYSKFDILLVGFADSTGSYDKNMKLSLQRAEYVKSQIESHAQNAIFEINAVGFGEENPVAPNDTDANKNKNRRVEIWLVEKNK